MPIELVWTKELDGAFDLRQIANELLKSAKENLQKDGYLQSGVFIVTKTELHCYSVAFAGYEEKECAYGEAVLKAHDLGATAIVTLNDAFVGRKLDPDEKYEWGQVASDPKGECIFLTISGPGLKNYTNEIEYRRVPDGFEFSSPKEEEDSFIGILGEWSSTKSQRVN